MQLHPSSFSQNTKGYVSEIGLKINAFPDREFPAPEVDPRESDL